MSDEIPTFDLGEFCGDLKAALAERFTEVGVHREPRLDDWRQVWCFTAATDAPNTIKVSVVRKPESDHVTGYVFVNHCICAPIGSIPLVRMSADGVSPTSAIIKTLCDRIVNKIRVGSATNTDIKSVLAAAKPGTPFHAAVADANAKFERAASRVTDSAVAVGLSAPQPPGARITSVTVDFTPTVPHVEDSSTVAPPYKRVPIRYADLEGDGLKHDNPPDTGRLIKATPIHMGLARPSLLSAARKAGVAAPPPDPTPVLDADGGREIPAPVGFDSPADLRRLGRRPLVTCDDGPTTGWGTYYDD